MPFVDAWVEDVFDTKKLCYYYEEYVASAAPPSPLPPPTKDVIDAALKAKQWIIAANGDIVDAKTAAVKVSAADYQKIMGGIQPKVASPAPPPAPTHVTFNDVENFLKNHTWVINANGDVADAKTNRVYIPRDTWNKAVASNQAQHASSPPSGPRQITYAEVEQYLNNHTWVINANGDVADAKTNHVYITRQTWDKAVAAKKAQQSSSPPSGPRQITYQAVEQYLNNHTWIINANGDVADAKTNQVYITHQIWDKAVAAEKARQSKASSPGQPRTVTREQVNQYLSSGVWKLDSQGNVCDSKTGSILIPADTWRKANGGASSPSPSPSPKGPPGQGQRVTKAEVQAKLKSGEWALDAQGDVIDPKRHVGLIRAADWARLQQQSRLVKRDISFKEDGNLVHLLRRSAAVVDVNNKTLVSSSVIKPMPIQPVNRTPFI